VKGAVRHEGKFSAGIDATTQSVVKNSPPSCQAEINLVAYYKSARFKIATPTLLIRRSVPEHLEPMSLPA
jgi:hypothetical protein